MIGFYPTWEYIMTRIVWSTDIHLNFLSKRQTRKFAKTLLEKEPTIIVFSGDLSEANLFDQDVQRLKSYLENIPVYFVCGNHDYYQGSIIEHRKHLKRFYNKDAECKWLPNMGVVSLTKDTALIGHDGWYDGGYADWFQSIVKLSDYFYIEEFAINYQYTPDLCFKELQSVAKESADYFKKNIKRAFKKHETVYLITHVSPFKESCLNPKNSEISDADWMPHFSSKASGDAILEAMEDVPYYKKLIILCGHTHAEACHYPLPNVICLAGEADYYKPKVNGVFEL
jgi:Icc-related predicted phosphoesterase